MSILLEALKKSERARKLGETPSLATPVADDSAAHMAEGSLVPVLLIVLSAVVMAWFGWKQYSRPEPVDTMAEPAMVSTRTDPSPEAAMPQEPGPRTMTEYFQAQAGDSTRRQSADPDSDAGERPTPQQSVEQFVAEPGDEPAATSPDSAIMADAQAAMQSLAQEQEPEERPADPGLEPHIAEPISYWELPQGVRDSLPEIKITVLVYAEEPADRFLLSNGQRLVEKEELDSGLVLDEIRRDGAVFTFRKYRFLVKG